MRLLRVLIKILPKIASFQERKIVLENFISLSTLQGLGYILPIFLLTYLLRIIGPEKFGIIAFAQAFVQYFLILTDYGFSISATRQISLHRDRKQKVHEIFSTVMTVKIILAALSFLIFLTLINLVPKFRREWLVYLLSFGMVIGNTLFPVWFYQGKEKMKYITSINSFGGIAAIFCIFIVVKGPSDYIFVPLINSIFALTAGVWALYIAFKEFELDFVLQTYKTIQQELKAGWRIFISIVSINAYTASRVFSVGLLTNNTVTGYYSAAERIAGFIQTFPLDAFSQALYPRINKAFIKNKERAIKIMRKIQKTATVGFLISLPIAFLFSPWIVRLVCGRPYPQVILTLRLLLVSVFFVGANAYRIQFLLVCGRADIYSRIHIIAALLGLPSIFLLIYLFSFPGAAISALITEAGIYLATVRLLKKIT